MGKGNVFTDESGVAAKDGSKGCRPGCCIALVGAELFCFTVLGELTTDIAAAAAMCTHLIFFCRQDSHAARGFV